MQKIIRITFILLLAIVSFVPAQAAPWQEKVSPQLLEDLSQGETDFLIMLSEQADLHAAVELPTKEAKGEYVFRTLTELAARTQPPVLAVLKDAGGEYQAYWIANLIWARGDAQLVQRLASRPDVAFIAANPETPLDLPEQSQTMTPQVVQAVEWNIAKVSADDLWNAGFNGQGVVVAGQDTGYDWDHPGLINQYRGWNGVSGDHDYNWHDAIHVTGSSCGADSPEPCDDHGHGTHTMGTMVGDDGSGNQVGMAPGARWIGCRNMNSGVGTPQTYTECFQWFVAPTKLDGTLPRTDLSPDVISNSWGCPPSEGCDANAITAMQTVVENVRAAGIMIVASAGNDGYQGCGSVNDPPAIYDASFTVGATTSTDDIAGFSSRGPADYTGLPKPDVSAPGTGIRSTARGGGYVSMQGTSMAAPHVAGEVALLISVDPTLRGEVNNLEALIRQSAVPRTSSQTCGSVPGSSIPNNTYGWGRIDAWAAYELATSHSLTIAKQAPAAVYPDQAITYTLTVMHEGFFPTHGLVLTDTLPLSTTFVTATQPYTLTGDLIEWQLAKLGSSSSLSVTLTVQPQDGAGSMIANVYYGTRSMEVTQTVGGPSVFTQVLDSFSVDKQAPSQVAIGSVITYTLKAYNHDVSPPPTVILTDTIPVNTTFITATLPYTLSGDTITWPIVGLDSGDLQSITLTVQLPITFTGVITNSNYGLRTLDGSFDVSGLPVETQVLRFYYFPILFGP